VIPRRLNGKARAKPGKIRRNSKFNRRIIGLAKTCRNRELSGKRPENVLNHDANFRLSGIRTLDRRFVAPHNTLIYKDFIDLRIAKRYGYD
jgi:hypothetical protein